MSYITDLPAGVVQQSKQAGGIAWDHATGTYSGRMRFYAPTPVLYQAMDVIAGSTEWVNTGTFGVRYIPLRWPGVATVILAESADFEWVAWDPTLTGPSGETGWFRGAVINVSFRSPPWPVTGADAMLEISSQPATYPMPLAPGAMAAAFGFNNPLAEVKEVGGRTYAVRLPHVATFNDAAWANVGGIINDSPWRGHNAYCVKFPGVQWERTVRFSGVTTWALTLPFEARVIPWNQSFDAGGNLVTHSLYTAVNFTTLFGF